MDDASRDKEEKRNKENERALEKSESKKRGVEETNLHNLRGKRFRSLPKHEVAFARWESGEGAGGQRRRRVQHVG